MLSWSTWLNWNKCRLRDQIFIPSLRDNYQPMLKVHSLLKKTEKESFLPLEDNVIPYLFDNYHPTLNLHSYKKETGKESSAV